MPTIVEFYRALAASVLRRCYEQVEGVHLHIGTIVLVATALASAVARAFTEKWETALSSGGLTCLSASLLLLCLQENYRLFGVAVAFRRPPSLRIRSLIHDESGNRVWSLVVENVGQEPARNCAVFLQNIESRSSIRIGVTASQSCGSLLWSRDGEGGDMARTISGTGMLKVLAMKQHYDGHLYPITDGGAGRIVLNEGDLHLLSIQFAAENIAPFVRTFSVSVEPTGRRSSFRSDGTLDVPTLPALTVVDVSDPPPGVLGIS